MFTVTCLRRVFAQRRYLAEHQGARPAVLLQPESERLFSRKQPAWAQTVSRPPCLAPSAAITSLEVGRHTPIPHDKKDNV